MSNNLCPSPRSERDDLLSSIHFVSETGTNQKSIEISEKKQTKIPIRCMYVCMYAIVVVAAIIVIVLLLGGSSRQCGVRGIRGRLFYSYG